MCRCQQAAFILSKYMWLVEKSTSYGVWPTQEKEEKKNTGLDQTMLFQEEEEQFPYLC